MTKTISVVLPKEVYSRLLKEQQETSQRTGLRFVSVSSVAALAIDRGLTSAAEAADLMKKTSS